MSAHAIGRSVVDAVGGIPLFLIAPLYRRWHLRWGATDEEVHAKTITETTAFKVNSFETASWLLWDKPNSTWAWTLLPLDGGRTRLISRLKQRYRWQTPGPALLTVLLLEFGDFPMMRRLLKGIKARAEQESTAGPLTCP
jgi:hypothetical protein